MSSGTETWGGKGHFGQIGTVPRAFTSRRPRRPVVRGSCGQSLLVVLLVGTTIGLMVVHSLRGMVIQLTLEGINLHLE